MMKEIYKSLIKHVRLNTICVLSILLNLVNLITTHIVLSDETEFKLGSNVLLKESKPFDVIYNSVAYKVDSFSVVKNKTDIGYWSDKDKKGRKSSMFISNGFGLQPEYKQFNLELFSSIAYISHTDSRLSTKLQFKHDLGLHYKLSKDYKIGMSYNHFSNGGIKSPNRGRDFMSLSITLY